MPTTQQILRYSSDPAAFFADLQLPSARGTVRFGNVMAPFQRERFASLIPALLAVANGTEPPTGKHWWEATKGSSKDTDLAACFLWLLCFTRRPLNCQVGAADQDQADELRKSAKLILAANPWIATRVEIQNWRLVSKATNSEVEIIAADVAGSHGAKPHVLVLNEVHAITRWEFAANLLDNASKQPWGIVICATNAGFVGTEAWKLREIARESDRWAFHQFTEPAPWLDPAEVEEARRRNTLERFLRLFAGVWSRGTGQGLDVADVEAAINRELQRHATALANFSYIAGLDLGVKNDHSALVTLAADPEAQRVRLADAMSWAPSLMVNGRREVDLDAVEREALEVHRRFRCPIRFDPHQAYLMAQRLRRQGVQMIEVPFVGSNLNLMASTMLESFRSHRVDLYDHPRLVADLLRLSIVEKSFGYKLEAVRDADGHADLAAALAIALPAAVDLAGSSAGMNVQLDFDPRLGTEQFLPGYSGYVGRPGPQYDDGPGWGVNNFW